jgi:hypothetical protein
MSLARFLWDSGGGADLEPALRQMVEHADFLDDLPWLVIRQHEAHDTQSDRPPLQRDLRDQQVGRGAVGGTEMVLAEEDPLVAEQLGARPEIEIPVEIIG